MAFETPILLSALAGLDSSYLMYVAIIRVACSIQFHSIKEANNENELEDTKTQGQKGQLIYISKKAKINIFINTIYFVLDSLVFSVLGVIVNSIFATTIGNNFQQYLSYIGGIVIIAFGANLNLSLEKLRWLNFERKLTKIPKFKTRLYYFICIWDCLYGWVDSFVLDPILGSHFCLGCYKPWNGVQSIACMFTWFRVPFLITGAFFSQATGIIKKITKHLKYFNLIMGEYFDSYWHLNIFPIN